jgi:hypothetical protein
VIGGLSVGWVGEQFGARASPLIGGLPTIAVGAIAYPFLARLDHRAHAAEAQEAGRTPDPVDDAEG